MLFRSDYPTDLPIENFKEYSRQKGDRFFDLFIEAAKKYKCNIIYPTVREASKDKFFNSITFIDRDGRVTYPYDKNYLVGDENPKGGLSYAKDADLLESDFGKVGCLICFDLNFDELRRRYAHKKPDLLVFSSMFHGGDVMQSYWAYSCRCHFVSAVAGLPSQIRNPFGEVIASSTNYRDYAIATVNLDCCLAHYDYNGDKLSALKAKFGRKVDIHDPGEWG